jgi:tRNA modification GTPase
MTPEPEGPPGSELDPIAAIATPAGAGGVGIVRISGPGALDIVCRVIGKGPDELPDRLLCYAVARDRDGLRIDEVLAVAMRGPRSFTGEDVAEIHGHGGAVNMGRLLAAVLDAGARQAGPGEFTRRAFEHGRLDLTRAEALASVIEASSERAWRIAQAQLEGGLGERIGGERERVVALLADIEVSIDFPEEDVELAENEALGRRAEAIAADLAALAASFEVGKALREGIEVALVGPVNAGKSSLLNALVESERALVAEQPGTTRDVLEARVEWEGIPITLVDTAGERDAETDVERRGIELGRRRARHADVELVLIPADRASAGELPAASARRIVVLSKADRLAEWPAPPATPAIATSAHTGEGLDLLKRAVVEAVSGTAREADDGVIVTSERQRRGIAAAADALSRARARLTEGAPAEISAIDVREASARLAEVLGDEVADEMLDDLFSRFCIGK